ncbi:MAG: hypothetical protein NTY77_07900 [Elusimicrobia bacterium]|nr:hypothetical protein [Elusimicrobiota bacterium]
MPAALPQSLEPMLSSQPLQAGIYTALGGRLLPSWFLRSLVPALAQGARVFWIDAGNSFDAHGLSRTAQALGLEPRRILSRISLARPFNVFQLQTMVKTKLPALWKGEPVVLCDPLGPFYDEDLPDAEVPKALAGLLEGLRRLPAVWLVLAVMRKRPEGRQDVLQALVRQSKRLAWLEEDGQAPRLRAIEKEEVMEHGTHIADDRDDLAVGGSGVEALPPRFAQGGPGGLRRSVAGRAPPGRGRLHGQPAPAHGSGLHGHAGGPAEADPGP